LCCLPAAARLLLSALSTPAELDSVESGRQLLQGVRTFSKVSAHKVRVGLLVAAPHGSVLCCAVLCCAHSYAWINGCVLLAGSTAVSYLSLSVPWCVCVCDKCIQMVQCAKARRLVRHQVLTPPLPCPSLTALQTPQAPRLTRRNFERKAPKRALLTVDTGEG
jgi:hypothetical protein